MIPRGRFRFTQAAYVHGRGTYRVEFVPDSRLLTQQTIGYVQKRPTPRASDPTRWRVTEPALGDKTFRTRDEAAQAIFEHVREALERTYEGE